MNANVCDRGLDWVGGGDLSTSELRLETVKYIIKTEMKIKLLRRSSG